VRPVNLLPEQYRRRAPTGRAGGAYIVVGALLAVLIGSALYILASNQVNDRKDELVKVQNETRRAQAEAASLAAFGNFSQVKQTRVDSVRSLSAQRFDFERLTRELAHVLPRGTWIASFDASAKPTGESAAGGPTLKLSGCAPAPSAVATVLVRLRKLHRSEDVRLASSAQGAGTGGATTACGTNRGKPNYSFELNVDFSPTPSQSDIIATDKVPASLGGGQ
jgi:Tfp pilus assembly protein PilN